MELESAEEFYEIQVSARGDTVWVNGIDGSCLARFSKRFGIDVHRTAADQLKGGEQCLFCTHTGAGPGEWEHFRIAVKEHHGIDVPVGTIAFTGDDL
ncbi:hypothetical protein [Cupriavidus sp. TMH.W2]|uniref:hypothetical protein n=1 Tax=Cupriavidus sp. TMH.W2 TaxID=3434465 RepID=UPI003D772AE1